MSLIVLRFHRDFVLSNGIIVMWNKLRNWENITCNAIVKHYYAHACITMRRLGLDDTELIRLFTGCFCLWLPEQIALILIAIRRKLIPTVSPILNLRCIILIKSYQVRNSVSLPYKIQMTVLGQLWQETKRTFSNTVTTWRMKYC